MRLTGKDLAMASQGEWLENKAAENVDGIGTDTREFQTGHAFLALRGPNFDGHVHAEQVADRASALIGDDVGMLQWKSLSTPQLKVEDTLQSLGDIAGFYRSRLLNTTVIAITGSYGKTTVRSMLEHVLHGLGLKVEATQANFNNLIGVPKTLLNIDMKTDVALIECGISEKGEMQRLSEIVRPDVAIVTGLSHAHGEGLGELQDIAKEKAKLMTHLSEEGWCALGHGVQAQFEKAACLSQQTTLSADNASSVCWHLKGQTLQLTLDENQVAMELDLPAKHWAEDMALVATVSLSLGKDLDQNWTLHDIGHLLASWHPVEGRMAVHHMEGFTLIDDAYNANPKSMQAALDTLAALDGYRIAIVGDMLELGEETEMIHQQLELHDIDEVFTVGDLAGGLQVKNPHCHIRTFPDVYDLEAWLVNNKFPTRTSTVLVKGSHGTGLYQVSKLLKERGQHVI
ncbi:MAG: UDP-N-acetylmuramoyl-tripeptide--D-alanyl-D-alanine ligase [Ghiorsea sp.]